jgi:hypothetical protein
VYIHKGQSAETQYPGNPRANQNTHTHTHTRTNKTTTIKNNNIESELELDDGSKTNKRTNAAIKPKKRKIGQNFAVNQRIADK